MTFATQHNKPKAQFNYELTDHQYTTLKELDQDTVYLVQGLYINDNSLYGDAPVIVTDKYLVNAPQHLTKQVNKIIRDPRSVKQINDGLVGFKIVSYTNDYGQQLTIEWVDL